MSSRKDWLSIMNGHIINKIHICEIEYLDSDLDDDDKGMFTITLIGGIKHDIYESNKNHNFSDILAYWNEMHGYNDNDDNNDDYMPLRPW